MDHTPARDRFDTFLAEENTHAQKRALARALSDDSSTVGDLLSCLHGSGVVLDPDDPITIGELSGRGQIGPSAVSVLMGFGVPLDGPLDVEVEDSICGRLLSDLLTPSHG